MSELSGRVGDRERCVDILRVLYLRFMRLRFSFNWLSVVCDPYLELKCPDLCYCLRWSFATEAYIMIDGMFSNGTYSFKQLVCYDAQIEDLLLVAKARLDNAIPDFHIIRNRVFAHFIDKQDDLFVRDIVLKFPDIFAVVTALHERCRYILGVSDDDIGGYRPDVFYKMEEQIDLFRDIVHRGYTYREDDELFEKLQVLFGK